MTPHYGRTLLEAVDDDRDGRMLSTDDGCVDTENGAVDSGSDDCTYYDSYSSYLGDRCTNINGGATDFDDDDFTAADMCCSCGGGYRAPTPKPTTQECTWAPTFATAQCASLGGTCYATSNVCANEGGGTYMTDGCGSNTPESVLGPLV